jgi:RimJ/RimL family protein N-acetyltransferase
LFYDSDKIIGISGFKDSVTNSKIEIFYSAIPKNEDSGYATRICKHLIDITQFEDPAVTITARTLMY